jgi:hypothetical protein
MSPASSNGINDAIMDTVPTANILTESLKAGRVTTADLARVQRRRELPTRIIQAIISGVQDRVINRAGPAHGLSAAAALPLMFALCHSEADSSRGAPSSKTGQRCAALTVISVAIWRHTGDLSQHESVRRCQASTQDFLEHQPGCRWGQLHGAERLLATTAAQGSFTRCAEIAHPVALAVAGDQKAPTIVFVEVHRERTRLSCRAAAHGEQEYRIPEDGDRNTCAQQQFDDPADDDPGVADRGPLVIPRLLTGRLIRFGGEL